MMTLVGSLVAGLAATWKHVPEAETGKSKSRKKVLPNQLGRYYDKNHSNNLVDPASSKTLQQPHNLSKETSRQTRENINNDINDNEKQDIYFSKNFF